VQMGDLDSPQAVPESGISAIGLRLSHRRPAVGGATIMPPSPLTSMPGPSSDDEHFILMSGAGCLKRRWTEPDAEIACKVSGNWPCSACSRSSAARPSTPCPSTVSASMTTKPLMAPVGTPMPALGQRVKSAVTSAALRVIPHLRPLLYSADL